MSRLILCLVCVAFFLTQWHCSGSKQPGTETPVVDGGVTDVTGADSTVSTEQQTGSANGKLVINEVVHKGDPSDWVEIYNAGDTAVDLTGWTLTDDKTVLDKGKFADGVTIQPGEYKVFLVNDETFGFKLGGDEELVLSNPKGEIVDQVDWNDGDATDGKSFGRMPDRTGSFKTLNTPTEGKANVDNTNGPVEPANEPVADAGTLPEPKPEPKVQPEPTPEPAPVKGLVINEVAAAGDPDDWFELYNGTNQTIDLSDYSVADDLQDANVRVKFPKDTKIKPGEYLVFKLTKDWPDFKLGKDEELGLFDKDGKMVDSVNWNDGDSPDGKSFARIPDGTGTFQTVDPTEGKKNN